MSLFLCNSAARKLITSTIVQSSKFSQCPKGLFKKPGVQNPWIRLMSSQQRLVPGTKIPYPPVDPQFKALCAKYQAPNDLPVHLKGGPMDAVLVKLTAVLIYIGLAWWGIWILERYNIK